MSKAIKNNTVNKTRHEIKQTTNNSSRQWIGIPKKVADKELIEGSWGVSYTSAIFYMNACFVLNCSIRHSPTGSHLCHKIQATCIERNFPCPSQRRSIFVFLILIEVSGSVRSSRGKQQNWNTLLEVESSCTRRFAHNCAKGKICTRQSTKSFITSKLKISKEPCTSKVLAMWYHLLRRGNRRFPLIARVSHHHRAHRLW